MILLSALGFVNSMWPSDALCWLRSESILTQVIACLTLTPPCYYKLLSMCGFFVSFYRCQVSNNIDVVSHLNNVVDKRTLQVCLWEIIYIILHMLPDALQMDEIVNQHAEALWFNTLRPRQKCRHFAGMFKCIFLNGNARILLTISLK